MTGESTTRSTADIARIMQLLPHRYPFLLIDRLDRHRRRAIGDWRQERHDERAVLPGTFSWHGPSCRACCSSRPWRRPRGPSCSIILGDEHAGKLVFFMSIDKARFRKPVVPGDTVRFKVKLAHRRPPVWKYDAEAMVDGKKVAEAEIGAMLMNERGKD